jgi:hypothetical protein
MNNRLGILGWETLIGHFVIIIWYYNPILVSFMQTNEKEKKKSKDS